MVDNRAGGLPISNNLLVPELCPTTLNFMPAVFRKPLAVNTNQLLWVGLPCGKQIAFEMLVGSQRLMLLEYD